MHTLSALLATGFFDGQTRGNYKPFAVVFLFGMFVGICGHVVASRDLIIAGIVIAGAASSLPWVLWA